MAAYPRFTKTYHTTAYPAIDPIQPKLSAKGKTIIVTGGASAIGSAIVESFAKAGAENIAIIGRTEKTLLDTKANTEAAHPSTKVIIAVANISDPESVGSAAHQIRTAVGAWDVFVHNAGFLPNPTSLAGADTDDWWQAFETNVKFTHIFAKHFLTKCRTNATFISVSAGFVHIPAAHAKGTSAYSASKMAAWKLNEYLAAENPGLRVFTVHPGVIESAMTGKVFGKRDGPDVPDFEDSALAGNFMVWLASEEAEFLRARFVWAQWDVDEMVAKKAEIEANPLLLTPTMGGWPFPGAG